MTPGPRLRPLRSDDAPGVLAAFRSAPDMTRQGQVTDAKEAEAYVAGLVAPAGAHRAFVVEAEGGVVAALVGVSIDAANRVGWLWYWTHAGHRGRGLASRAAATVANWALLEGGCERLELGHRANNPASRSVALAAGFVQEGVEREKFLVAGRRVDVLTYGRLRSDPPPATPLLPLSSAPCP